MINFKLVFEKERGMIFLKFIKKILSETDKQRYARIIGRIMPILMKFQKDTFSLNKNIDIDTKIIFR